MILEQTIQSQKQLNELDRALLVAAYFGFSPITAPKITKDDIALTQECGNHPHFNAADKLSVMRTYLEQNLASLPHPLALAYKRMERKKTNTYTLHFIGSTSGIAEATLIRAALSILSEEGCKNLRVDINCLGDKESIHLYERELTNYVRKFGVEFSEEFKQSVKEDVFNLFRLGTPEAISLREIAPSAITFLSPQSRIYFKEVLEYIEALGIEFRLTPELVGERNQSSHTIFAIKDTEDKEENTLAIGYRYSRLGRYLGLRKEIPMTGVTVFASSEKDNGGKIYKDLPKPKFYLVQLGREAKIKTLCLIESLREHSIPVHHFLGRDKLTTQLSNADNLRVSHLIIIGQKEALDNTATVRNISTRAQDTINLVDLPRYLKHIKL
jgi:histidyl-tRNA synthetase